VIGRSAGWVRATGGEGARAWKGSVRVNFDWNPAAPCVALANMPANRLMTVQVYSGAYQTFDNWGMRAQYMLGYMLTYDAAANAGARARVQSFRYQYRH